MKPQNTNPHMQSWNRRRKTVWYLKTEKNKKAPVRWNVNEPACKPYDAPSKRTCLPNQSEPNQPANPTSRAKPIQYNQPPPMKIKKEGSKEF